MERQPHRTEEREKQREANKQEERHREEQAEKQGKHMITISVRACERVVK